MRKLIEFLIRVILLVFIWFIWWLVINSSFSRGINLSIIMGGILLTFPLVWIGRKILDQQHTISQINWITTFVHFGLGFTLAIPLIRALITYKDWSGWVLPITSEIGLIFVFITGIILSLIVLNLAIKGFGAPFFIALSNKLAVDWFYAWTRNPMVVAALAFLLSLGIWFKSLFFILWALILFTPGLLYFVKVYEERELEFRFGASYLEYKSKTPMLCPRKPSK